MVTTAVITAGSGMPGRNEQQVNRIRAVHCRATEMLSFAITNLILPDYPEKQACRK